MAREHTIYWTDDFNPPRRLVFSEDASDFQFENERQTFIDDFDLRDQDIYLVVDSGEQLSRGLRLFGAQPDTLFRLSGADVWASYWGPSFQYSRRGWRVHNAGSNWYGIQGQAYDNGGWLKDGITEVTPRIDYEYLKCEEFGPGRHGVDIIDFPQLIPLRRSLQRRHEEGVAFSTPTAILQCLIHGAATIWFFPCRWGERPVVPNFKASRIRVFVSVPRGNYTIHRYKPTITLTKLYPSDD